jgi:hypothetical protein
MVRLKGEQHWCARLTEEEVLAIHGIWRDGGMTNRQIAAMFGTSSGNIANILSGRKWRYVKEMFEAM